MRKKREKERKDKEERKRERRDKKKKEKKRRRKERELKLNGYKNGVTTDDDESADEETRDIYLMVVAGLNNKRIVKEMIVKDLPAVGIWRRPDAVAIPGRSLGASGRER